MNYKALCVLLSAAMILPVTGCSFPQFQLGRQKAPVISGSYEGAVPVTGSQTDLGIGYFESSLPVYLDIAEDNTFKMELGLKELKKDLYDVADDIEADGVYIVKDVTVDGVDYYEGTVQHVDDQFVFSGEGIEFTAFYEDGVLTAEDLLGESFIEFQ